jgi:hypothetical protein
LLNVKLVGASHNQKVKYLSVSQFVSELFSTNVSTVRETKSEISGALWAPKKRIIYALELILLQIWRCDE